ncbi:MAG: ethanolamine utilization protein EutJ, partial [Chloroflexi bacterium HGW-Chloroflexi-10]
MGYRHWIKGFISLMMVLSTVFSGIETASAFTRSDYFQTKSQAQATLKIALLAPITGPAAAFGASSQKGAQMAIDEWNAEGGVLGNSVALEIKDTQCDPTAAADAANAVVSEDIHYIIGEVCSSASLSIAQIAEDNHIVQITPLSTNPRVTLNDDDTTKQFVFRACFIDAYQGGMMAKFALDNNWTKAFVLHDPSSAYSTELAAAFRDAYDDAGGAIVGDDSYQSSDTDFTTLIDSIKTSQADIVYLPDYSNIANPFLAQARASGVSATFLGGDGWDSGDLDGTATEGSYFTTHFSKDDNHLTVHKWVSQYVTKYNQDPDLSAALTYEAVDILLTAIQSAGADDPSLVKDILAGLDFNSLTGSLTFDAQHNPNKPVIIKQVQGNSPVF